MKKILFILLAFIAVGFTNVNAQTFGAGSLGLNFGFGCGSSNGDWYYGGTKYHNSGIFIPSFNFALDYGIIGNVINRNGSISAGGYFGIGQGSRKENNVKHIASEWRVGTRGALHYQWVPNLDTYAGIGLGFRHDGYKIKTNNDPKWTDSGFDFHVFAGARYMFGSVGIFSELQTTDFSYFQIGLTFIL